MTIITTRKEQQTAAAAARRAGGYDELIRQSAEYQRNGENAVARDRGNRTTEVFTNRDDAIRRTEVVIRSGTDRREPVKDRAAS